MCTQLTPFKTIWTDFYIVYPIYSINSFQDHLTRFLHSVANWLLSRPCDLIFVLFTQLTPFKTIWSDFYIVYRNYSFQDHIDLILSLCTQLTPFKTIWPNFVIVYTIDSFQDHLTWCLYCVPKSLISNHMTPFKTIWPDFCIVYPIDFFQDHLIWFYHSEPNWLLSRPFDLILSLCTQLSPFKTIWPDFCIVYPNDSFQTIWCILSLCTQVTAFKTIWPDFCTVYPVDSNLHKMHTFSWNLEISWKYAHFHLICIKLMKDQLGYTLNKSSYKVLKGVN